MKRGDIQGVFFLAIALGHAVAAPAEDWIKLFGGPTYHLVSRVPDAIISMPVPVILAKEVPPDKVSVVLRDVLFNNRHETQFKDAFAGPDAALRVAPPAAGFGPSIMMTIDPRKAGGDGTYTLALTAQTDGKADIPLQVQIAYPPARLRAVPTLILEHVWPYEPTEWLTVPLHETAGVALSGPQARLGSFPQVAEVSLVENPQSPGVAARDEGSAYVRLKVKAPLGTHAGTVEIDADQLAEPLAVPLQIVKRRTRWLIPLVMLSGILLGYLLRTALSARIEQQEARLRALDLLTRIDTDRKRRPDARFWHSLEQPLTDLYNALPTEATSELAAKAQKLDNEWQAALRDFEVRRAALQQKHDTYAALAVTPWRLFDEAEAVRSELRRAVTNANGRLAGNDVLTAETELENARQSLVGDLEKAIPPWRRKLQNDLSRASQDNLALPASVSNWLRSAAAALQPSLAKVSHVPVSASATEVAPILQAVHDVRVNLSDLSQELRLQIEDAVRAVVAALKVHLKVEEETLSEIRTRAAAVDRALQDLEGEPETALSYLLEEKDAETLRRLDDAIASPLRTAAKNVSGPEAKSIADLLDARQYLEAAAVIAQVVAAQAPKRDEKLGDIRGVARTAGTAVGIRWLPRSYNETPPSVAPGLRTEPVQVPLEDLRAHTWRELLASRALRTVLTGSLILASGFFVFASGFVGTPEELGKVFSWAFALDVSVDTLATVLPRRT